MATSSSDNAVTKTVQEALTLIEDGNKILSKHRNVSDIVLVIGNTGAGKTTISTLLANPDELECYNAGDCNLIYDKSAKISTAEDTTVSKTDVPEIFFHKETNTAIYDLPGFCDTRSASNEIANAFFMKKVADQAKRVKLLFVINHASLLSGGYRNDIKSFLENAMDLIKNPEKFAPGIGLVATKVRGDYYPEEVISGVAQFLKMTQKNLSETFPDESKRKAVNNILNALLAQDANKVYNRIVYFCAPKTLGVMSDLASVKHEREQIISMLQQNVSYCPSTPEDFGLSVSSRAHRLILQMGNQLKGNIANIYSQIGQKLENSFKTAVEIAPSANVGTLVKTISNFEESIHLLQESQGLSRGDFFQRFWGTVSSLEISDGFATETTQLEQIEEQLKFLEDFTEDEFPYRVLEWTIPINFAIKHIQKAVEQKISAFQDEMEAQLRQLAKHIDKYIQVTLEGCKEDANRKSKLLRLYTSKIVHLNEGLSGAKSVNEFIHKVRSSTATLGSSCEASLLVPLEDDLRFTDIFVNVWQWRKCFEDLQGKLREESSLHSMRSQNKEEIESLRQKAEEETNRQNQRIKDMEAVYQKRAEEHEAKLNKEKKEMQEQLDRVKRDFGDQQKRHTEEIERQRKELDRKVQDLKAQNEKEMKILKEDADNKAKEQSKRMEEMKVKHEKHAKELEEKQKKEKEEMDKKLRKVEDDSKEQVRKHKEAAAIHQMKLEDKLQALEHKNMIEMMKLKFASAVERMDLNQRMEQEKAEMVKNARDQEDKLKKENEEIQKRINEVTQGCRNLENEHKVELENQRLKFEAFLATVSLNAQKRDEENARVMQNQQVELANIKKKQKEQHAAHLKEVEMRTKAQVVRWVRASGGDFPQYSVCGGQDRGRNVYVARAAYDGALVPGKLHTGHRDRAALIPYVGKEIRVNTYEVLVDPHGCCNWVNASNGNVPSNAVEGGRSKTGEIYYIARVHYDYAFAIGKVHPSHRCCYIPYGNKENKYDFYDVLVI